MATGKHPFNADSSAETISSILSHAPPRVRTLKSELPARARGRSSTVVSRRTPRSVTRRRVDLRHGAGQNSRTRRRGSPSTNRRPSSTRRSVSGQPPVARSTGLDSAGGRRTAAASCVAAGASVVWKARSAPVPSLRSLAVLPFANLSGDPETRPVEPRPSAPGSSRPFASIEGLQIVGRSESWNQRDTSPGRPASRVWASVRWSNGEIQQDGSVFEITVSLTDTATGFVLWSHTYTHRRRPGVPNTTVHRPGSCDLSVDSAHA